MRSLPMLSLLLGLGLGLGLGSAACNHTDAPSSSEPGPRDALSKDRKALADPQVHRIRNGTQIDEDALRKAMLRLRSAHGPQLAVAYQASLEALPVQERPQPPAFVEIASLALPDAPAMRDVEAINWLFDEDVRATAYRALGTHLTIMMVQELDMSTHDVGLWMGFLRAAEPTLARCGRDGDVDLLCMDYGVDVFVISLRRWDPGWIVERVQWQQRALAEAPAR